MNTLVIIPARVGSKGIPGKNFRLLAGLSPLERAYRCAEALNPTGIAITTDAAAEAIEQSWSGAGSSQALWIARPAELAQDDTSMLVVIQHVLATIPGPEDQLIVLLQPTQPLRTPAHVRAAITALATRQCGSVISIVAAGPAEKLVRRQEDGSLTGWLTGNHTPYRRRQDCLPAYRFDGTVYAWYRREPFFAKPWWPLEIPASETVNLDTEADWAEAERQLLLGSLHECSAY